jgi:hypothetical protein
VLLVMTQDGSVGASLLDSPADATHTDALQKGVRRALAAFLTPGARPHCVPEALQRLTIDVPASARGKVRVRVLFEDAELLSEQREVTSGTSGPPACLRIQSWQTSSVPTQAIGIAAVEFHGRGL